MPSFALEHAQGSGRPEQCSNGRDMLTIHRYEQSIHSIFFNLIRVAPRATFVAFREHFPGSPRQSLCMAAATGRIMVRRGLWMRCTAHVMATGPVYGTRTAVRWGPSAATSVWWAPSGTSRSPHGLFRAPLCDPTVRMDGRCSCGAA